jgi:hypothetical protein
MTELLPYTKLYYGETLVPGLAKREEVWPVRRFDPLSLPGLAVWLDASAFAYANGSVVNSWTNLGSGPSLAPINSGQFPVFLTNALNGLPVVRFIPTIGMRILSGSGVHLDWTLAYVGRLVGPTPGRVVNAIYSPNNLVLGFWNGNEDVLYDNGFANNTYKPWTANWRLYSGDGSDSPRASRLFNDGVFLGSTTTSQGWGGTLALGGYAPASHEETCDCEVAEVLLYNNKLPDADRQKVEAYLRDKWAL